MIRISKLADYAVVILSVMAEQPNKLMSATSVSEITKLPEPTVSKVLKLLSKSGLLESKRGTAGGYLLAKVAGEITIREIIRAIDGPVLITSCSDGEVPDCSLSECCTLRGKWDGVNEAVRSALDGVTLADMMSNPEIKKESAA